MSEFCLSKTFNVFAREAPLKTNGGRPKKASHSRRNKCVTSSYTQNEYERLIQKAEKANLPPSILQREASLSVKVTARNYDAGLRLSIIQEFMAQAKYCRAELHKMERHLAKGQYTGSPPISPKRLKELGDLVEEKITLITYLLRKEMNL